VARPPSDDPELQGPGTWSQQLDDQETRFETRFKAQAANGAASTPESSHESLIGEPGGGPTQCRGDQRSGGGGDGAVFSLTIFYARGDQRSGGGGGGDGAAARKKTIAQTLPPPFAV
jgi:hypothetical protein